MHIIYLLLALSAATVPNINNLFRDLFSTTYMIQAHNSVIINLITVVLSCAIHVSVPEQS